jgi:hypothetical protein
MIRTHPHEFSENVIVCIKLPFLQYLITKNDQEKGELDFYIASSLKQQSADRHVAPLGHIILIPSQPIFAVSPQCCVLSGEAKQNPEYPDKTTDQPLSRNQVHPTIKTNI